MTLQRVGLETTRVASLVCLVFAVVAASATMADAQEAPGSSGGPFSFDGPAPPVPPATIARDQQGRMTVRANRLVSPLKLDGQIDEPAYTGVEPFSDFIQMDPAPGKPATEKTEVWIFFDQNNVYVTMRAWESQPDRLVAKEMRRDNANVRQGDCIGFAFDTFYDRRNSFWFEVNPLGGFIDSQVTNERQANADWNIVWDLAIGTFDGGWTLEAAIPFKSLRYKPGRGQLWGFQARRNNKSKNEISFVTRVPPSLGLGRGSFAASLFPTLVGIEAPPAAMNLEVKPYAITDLSTDNNAAPRTVNELGGDVGLDVKYAVTQNLAADITVNTDFAQVEADEQQVNLTRFSLFFPEKREFFLENRDRFSFGGANAMGMMTSGSGDAPTLFYSRRIGLSQGREVPIRGGGRLTGRLGQFDIGVINIQTGDEAAARAESTNFSVVRVKRDILRRSSVGALFTGRSLAQTGLGSNQAYGVDGTFTFFDLLSIATYWAKTRTEGLEGDDTSYRAHLDYNGDRYGVQVERLVIGDNFNPDVGFVRRDDMRQSWAQLRFSPRPRSIKSVRKFSWIGTMTYIEDGAGLLETREAEGEFAIEFQNSDRFFVGVIDSFERLEEPFRIAPAVVIPIGGYDFTTARAGYNFGQQRVISGNFLVEYGTFYDGHRTSLTFRPARVTPNGRFSVEPGASVNWIDLPSGSFRQTLVGPRVTYTMTPRMFASALIQYNSTGNLVGSNVRLRWEYRPGSELFVVYNEERDALARRFPDLENRAFIIKINRLFRF